MKRDYLRQHGRNGLDVLEEAFHLLRYAPPSVLVHYFVGTVPFLAAFLIFWTDMARSPQAPSHLIEATLGMTVLFVWMKYFQSRFTRGLLAHLTRTEPVPVTPARIIRSVMVQATLQATGLFLLPVAILLVVPLGWAYAFYQNVSALDDGDQTISSVLRKAMNQCLIWPGQNHLILTILAGFGAYVFLNFCLLAIQLPQLLRMFFGIESIFTQSPLSLLNTTFFAGMLALTYLCIDPLVKATYALRCFYGNSLRSGDDIRTELKILASRSTRPLAGAMRLLTFLAFTATLCAQENTPPPRSPTAPASAPVTAPKLDRSIDEVINQPKYLWRMPREKVEREDGVIASFFKNTFKMIEKFFRDAWKTIETFLDWLTQKKKKAPESDAGAGSMAPQLGLLYAALAIAACLLAVFILRMIRSRRTTMAAIASTAAVSLPDLEKEDLVADLLPEDEWTRLGRELLDRGDFRLALRAFYLANLALLAARGMISITRSKSNRDYEREIRRRGHTVPALPGLFSDNVGMFDRTWYGNHVASAEVVREFLTNLERMKTA